MDTTKSPEERARALLRASSRHQKYRWLVEHPANNPQRTTFEGGVTYPLQVPCTPTVVYTDGPDGVRFTPGVTAFPAPIALAATWNEHLAYMKAAAQGEEAFDKGKNVVLGPGLASGRTPLSGRMPEYLGEDPLLTGLLAAAGVNGLQEGNPGKPVLATLKHYLANEQELDRLLSSSNMDHRTFWEIYNLPFEITINRSAPEGSMCSYNQINGVYACENLLLNGVLKDDLRFDGYVVSDFGAVHTAAASLVNGLDQELNHPIFFSPARLDAALAAGEITQSQIDAAAFRVVRSYIRGGLFDHPLPAVPVANASTAEHKAIARTIADQGTVLLKNDGILPLQLEDGGTVAVIGPTASTAPTNGVSATSVCSMPWPFDLPQTLSCEDLVSPETGIRDRAAQDGAVVTYDTGSDLTAAAATAAASDIAVVLGYVRTGEFNDLPNLRLQGQGDALISAVASANPNTVVVLQTGSAVEMPWLSQVPAVLETWYGGEQIGPALAAVLFGDVSPSGKLPMTFPKSLKDTPTANSLKQYPGVRGEAKRGAAVSAVEFADGSTTGPAGSQEIRQVNYTEGLEVGYRWYESKGIEPLFPFGHGLSYTSFDYSNLQVTPATTTGTEHIEVRFRLANRGDRPGTEVAQVYVQLPPAADEPSKRLAGWKRVTLGPGEHRSVQITLDRQDLEDLRLLQYWDTDSATWVTPTGTYQVHVGGSSATSVSDSFVVQ